MSEQGRKQERHRRGGNDVWHIKNHFENTLPFERYAPICKNGRKKQCAGKLRGKIDAPHQRRVSQ